MRYGDEGDGGILADFLRDTPPVHAKNLYNLYVYFWRWALWKVFESGAKRGVVTFITASSYLRGPGFAGMRRHMREAFDELWILDLGGEGRGARRSENVFAIQTPVAIAIGYRSDASASATPARVQYARIDGTREEKLERLSRVHTVDDLEWRDCFSGWLQPFLPESSGDYFAWPALTDLFPWQHSGAQFKRTWPIAPLRETLEERWNVLAAAEPAGRAALVRETRDRKAGRSYPSLVDGRPLPPLAASDDSRVAARPVPTRYAYRSLDRQWCLPDARIGDSLRPPLWRALSSKQVYLTSFLTGLLGEGPAVVATHLVPDMHHFRGSYGAKHVIPLWRDAACREPNLTAGLLDALAPTLGPLEPEDVLAYAYALLQAPAYTRRFFDELEIPGPRIPVTRDRDLFARGVALGRRLVWLHTYGERFVPDGERAGRLPRGEARYVRPIGASPEAFPRNHRYEHATRELHVGEGVFAPVAPEVRAFSVSGLDVVGSWLDYRMRDGAGRRSSALDDIRPTRWPEEYTEELLQLLWVVEHTVALAPDLDRLLDDVVRSELVAADELPAPADHERAAPSER